MPSPITNRLSIYYWDYCSLFLPGHPPLNPALPSHTTISTSHRSSSSADKIFAGTADVYLYDDD